MNIQKTATLTLAYIVVTYIVKVTLSMHCGMFWLYGIILYLSRDPVLVDQ